MGHNNHFMKQRLIRFLKAFLILGGAIVLPYHLGILAYEGLCRIDALSNTLERVRNGAYEGYTSAILLVLLAVDAGLFIFILLEMIRYIRQGEPRKEKPFISKRSVEYDYENKRKPIPVK
jgi:hypothetical protein